MARRRSFGCVYKKSPEDKTWYVRFPDPSKPKTPSGRSAYTVRAVGPSRKAAERLLKEVRAAMLGGRYAAQADTPSGDGLTVLEAIDGYIAAKRAEGRAASTIDLYGYCRTSVEKSGLGRRLVADTSVRDIEAHLSWRSRNLRPGAQDGRAGTRASAATLSHDRELLSGAFNRLVRLGVLEHNVVAKVPKPKRTARKRVVLSKDEVVSLLDACRGSLRLLVLAALYTGARRGELLRLLWGDVSFGTGTIALHRSKTGNFSAIPAHPVLADELKGVKEARAVSAGRIIQDDEPVFLSRTGKPYRDCRSAWATAVERAGLANRKGLTFHSLRHTFACHFLEGGAAVTDLQALLGHGSLSTTQIYAGMVDARTKASVAALSYETGENEENVRTPMRTPAGSTQGSSHEKAAPESA